MHLNLPLVQAKLTVVDGKPPSSVLCHRDGGKPVLVVAPATSYPALPALPPEPAAAEAPLKEIVEGMAARIVGLQKRVFGLEATIVGLEEKIGVCLP